MASEMWQFAAFLGTVAVVFLLWLNIIYLPGRTLERRYDGAQRPRESAGGESRGPQEGEPTPSSSDPTR